MDWMDFTVYSPRQYFIDDLDNTTYHTISRSALYTDLAFMGLYLHTPGMASRQLIG